MVADTSLNVFAAAHPGNNLPDALYLICDNPMGKGCRLPAHEPAKVYLHDGKAKLGTLKRDQKTLVIVTENHKHTTPATPAVDGSGTEERSVQVRKGTKSDVDTTPLPRSIPGLYDAKRTVSKDTLSKWLKAAKVVDDNRRTGEESKAGETQKSRLALKAAASARKGAGSNKGDDESESEENEEIDAELDFDEFDRAGTPHCWRSYDAVLERRTLLDSVLTTTSRSNSSEIDLRPSTAN